MNTANWKYFTLNRLFDLKKGKRLTKADMTAGNTPFIGAIDSNNGYTEFISQDPNHKGNTITVTYNGSVAEAFYQPADFWASDDVNVLYPKFNLNRNIALFICAVIKKEKYRFNYGRKWHLIRMRESEILLPATKAGEPDFNFMDKFISSFPELKYDNNVAVSNPKEKRILSLDTSKWKTFKYGGKEGVFIIKNGYYNKKPDVTETGEIPFIGATENNNGVTGYYSLFDIETNHKDERSAAHDLDKKIFKGNCITVSNNGSVGCAFYQRNDFTCSHDINILYLKEREWNEYLAMFVCTLIQLEKYRWAYGRKWRPVRMPISEIKLPVTKQGKIDWEFMESFVKSLPYSGSL
ncbi:restriction endonuclease subunit S [Parafilimonas terrae]|uniref:Type I restriction modification DNA specificity domain-containing protein n=1 Tax=Parafilimonas terrae TaxID=1465490 RepID=A0A1I5ZGS0_9BACT|nr:restriction endonuclease subunit S [Parafilimonas terrae]SFQ55610.1 Type I restriction modification DNA specificity domain-containing protein [Parafilimonas terrae]